MNNSGDTFKHYKKLLNKGIGGSANLEGFEGVNQGASEPDLSDGGIKDRLQFTRKELKRIVKNFLGNKQELHQLAELIAAESDQSLRILRNEDEDKLNENPARYLGGLETIVRLDGSRPSFMIQNGEINRLTSPLGNWGDTLDASNDLLLSAISCVGRIDIPWMPPGFVGTGYLVQENLVLTNRHVLQLAAQQNKKGTWKFHQEVAIDFGHEFRAVDTKNRRGLKSVVFCGSEKIDLENKVDHKKLDLALIELEPATKENRPAKFLSIDKAPDWADLDTEIFTIGYPGKPEQGSFTPTLMEQLFQSTFGYKRLAPGLIMPPGANVQPWTLSHDASTLGGNSGSVVLVAGRETAAAGLHYGGQNSQPRQNWGHILGKVLEKPANQTTSDEKTESFFNLLSKFGVNLIDRVNA